jgi:hypothetical protein
MPTVEEDFSLEESDAEREARRETEVSLDEADQDFVDKLVDMLMNICDDLTGLPLRVYQKPLARRMFESFIIDDGAEITALFSRQSGKSQTIAAVCATAMIMLPRLAKIYPTWLDKYERGLWVGAFAPVDYQALILYKRVVGILTSDHAKEFMAHPEVNERVIGGKGNEISLKNCGSLCHRTTCHPRATIEGATYHVILIDEAQEGDNRTIKKSVLPMGANTNATVVLTGTCDYVKNFFYDSIQANKRVALMRGRTRKDHYQVNWREVAKVAPRYKRYVMKQAIKLGEDSDEFKLSYELLWLLEQGMFTTHEKFEELEDKTMQSVVYAYNGSPVCVGIDCARKKDRTIVTIVWVRWGSQDAAGFLEHRVLNWLDLEATEWETQYWKIKEFLDNYRIYKVAVDAGGLGDVVINRLRHIMPYIEFVDALDSPQESSVRWKYLKQLMDRQKIKWPGGAKVKQRKTFRRFRQEMEDLQMEYKTGGVVKVAAPEEEHAHDDYPNSLAMACMLSADENGKDDDRVVVYNNFLYERGSRHRG